MLLDSTRQPAAPHCERPAGKAVCAWRVRLRGAAAACAVAGVMAVLGGLTPSPEGFGTHTQLGGPYCSFLARTGYPCPTCGVTTSMAWAVRGRFLRAWSAHPLGVLLTAGLAAIAAAGLVELACGRPLLRASRRGLLLIAIFLAAGMMGGWAWKAAAGVMDGSLPLR